MPQTENYEYSISELLGSGSFGNVYKGITRNFGESVAIKSFEFTLDFHINREADTMALAHHENIVKFLGLEQVEGSNKRVLIMEYCAEGNLQEFIESKENGLSSLEFVRFCHNLVDAIKYLREIHIVHRDVKPSNVLLSKRDGEIVFKLADFGAARTLKANENYGSLYGTFEYLHPNIFEKFYSKDLNIQFPKQMFNSTHELWSIGVTFFEAATGTLPFETKAGRKDRNTMYQMTTKKEYDCLWAREFGGQIQWHKELPECNLDDSLKVVLTSMLIGLLQSSEENMCSFKQFFEEASKISLPPKNEADDFVQSPMKEQQKKILHTQRPKILLRLHRPKIFGQVQWWRHRKCYRVINKGWRQTNRKLSNRMQTPTQPN